MEYSIADVVISQNGRDKGKRFIIIKTEDEYSFLADGKRRKLEKPKRKKNKHITPEGVISDITARKLKTGEKVTNSQLRKTLAIYAADRDGRG